MDNRASANTASPVSVINRLDATRYSSNNASCESTKVKTSSARVVERVPSIIEVRTESGWHDILRIAESNAIQKNEMSIWFAPTQTKEWTFYIIWFTYRYAELIKWAPFSRKFRKKSDTGIGLVRSQLHMSSIEAKSSSDMD